MIMSKPVTSWFDQELMPYISGLVPGRFLVSEYLKLLVSCLAIGYSITGHFLVPGWFLVMKEGYEEPHFLYRKFELCNSQIVCLSAKKLD
jgi:hypothetical protein